MTRNSAEKNTNRNPKKLTRHLDLGEKTGGVFSKIKKMISNWLASIKDSDRNPKKIIR